MPHPLCDIGYSVHLPANLPLSHNEAKAGTSLGVSGCHSLNVVGSFALTAHIPGLRLGSENPARFEGKHNLHRRTGDVIRLGHNRQASPAEPWTVESDAKSIKEIAELEQTGTAG